MVNSATVASPQVHLVFWQTAEAIKDMTADQAARVKDVLRKRLAPDSNGHIAYAARTNAVRGRVPG